MQKLLGHKDVRITAIHTYMLNKGGMGVWSPMAVVQKDSAVLS